MRRSKCQAMSVRINISALLDWRKLLQESHLSNSITSSERHQVNRKETRRQIHESEDCCNLFVESICICIVSLFCNCAVMQAFLHYFITLWFVLHYVGV